ncbi:MAG: DNA gyrase C-terminal beta-propeller domain-containing protein, partial [Pseudomonadota bacterium]
ERFELTDNQAEAVLNLRLRALHKLEEFEIRKEFDDLTEEKAGIEALLADEDKQWKTIAWEIGQTKKKFGKTTEIGKRRSSFAEAAEIDEEAVAAAMIEKEPITVVLSQKGWIRTLKGHVADTSALTFKEGDSLKRVFPAMTTDRILLFTTAGKFYTLPGDKLPGGRGHGEPVRIMVDMENDADVLDAFVHEPGRHRLVASTLGNGFTVSEADVLANTRKGKQVLNVTMPVEAVLCVPFVPEPDGETGLPPDTIAVVGENRRMLLFPLDQVPQMTRGKGVRLQKYKDGGILDAKIFALSQGLSWTDSAERTHTRTAEELAEYIGERAQAGRMVPKGFPRNGKFSA